MSPKITAAQWRTAVEGSANEIATHALSLPSAIVQDPIAAEHAVSLIGAHIPIIGGGKAYDLALLSTPEGCKALSRAILCMSPGQPIKDAEFADAVGELANMLAGGIKRRLAKSTEMLELGLPIFLHGHIQPTDKLSVLALPTRFGTIDTMVVVTGQRE